MQYEIQSNSKHDILPTHELINLRWLNMSCRDMHNCGASSGKTVARQVPSERDGSKGNATVNQLVALTSGECL